MNDQVAADERIVEDTGDNPELSLNPHMGVPDEPEGESEKPVEDEKPTKDADAPSAGEDNAEPKPDDPKPEDNLQKKVGELAFENRQLKRQLEQREKAEPEVQNEPLKTLKDFEYDEGAYNGYLATEIDRRAEAAALRVTSKSQVESEADRMADQFAAREDAFEAENPGFKERLHADDLAITQEMALFIADPESELGLHVGDYLARNKAEAARIAGLSPAAQAREMLKHESRIGEELAKAKAEKTKVSKAPEPPANTVDGTDPGMSRDPTNPADADKMSHQDWLKAREKQLAKKRGR